MSVSHDKPATAWSRRRAAVKAEEASLRAAEAARERAQEQARLAEKTDAEVLQELDLPDPDSLQLGDDFAAFMKAAVPERLRRRALRKLWLSNPVLANVDNLLDYGEDFAREGAIVGALQTAYQVGKGMLSHTDALAAEAEAVAEEAEAVAESDAQPPVAQAAAPDDPTPHEATPDEATPDDIAPLAAAPPIDDCAPHPAPARRMRFEFTT